MIQDQNYSLSTAMSKSEKFKVIGCMSGTSLDGTDLAFCHFECVAGHWKFQIVEAETIPYSDAWKKALHDSFKISGLELFRLDHNYGRYLGEIILEFIRKHNIEADFIASHGHTVFHEPGKGGSLQIGNGHDIHALTHLPVIADFRSLDIALGGQGAPLVPAGDRLLFPDNFYCLNLGGFSNISYIKGTELIAFDICPVNTILNYFSRLAGQEFDNKGELGRKGKIIPDLVKQLNAIEYYKKPPPKSLGQEFLKEIIYPLSEKFQDSPENALASFYEHIATQITSCLNNELQSIVMVTGGGARNNYLLEKIKQKTANQIKVPDTWIIDFKEALIFAFLGVLRVKGINNCYASVTGSKYDNCGGVIYGQT